MNWYKKATSIFLPTGEEGKGVFDVNNPPKRDESIEHARPGIIAWMDCDGVVYYDKSATMHGDVFDSFPEIADLVIDAGFIINGKYSNMGSQGGFGVQEGENEEINKVEEFTRRVNTPK